MLAVLPQFINPHQPLLPQYVAITVTMVTVDMLVMAGYTGLAARVLRLLRTPKQQKRLNRTFAGLFIGAATFWRLCAARQSDRSYVGHSRACPRMGHLYFCLSTIPLSKSTGSGNTMVELLSPAIAPSVCM